MPSPGDDLYTGIFGDTVTPFLRSLAGFGDRSLKPRAVEPPGHEDQTALGVLFGIALDLRFGDAGADALFGDAGVAWRLSRELAADHALEPLMAALRNNTIQAAGLDVFLNEPNINPEWMSVPNVTLLPHVGSGTVYTRMMMDQLIVDNLIAWAAGKPS